MTLGVVKASLCASVLIAATASAVAQPGTQEPAPQPQPQPQPQPYPQQQPPPYPQQQQPPYPPQQPPPYPQQQPPPYPQQQPPPYQPYPPPYPQPGQRDAEQPPMQGAPMQPGMPRPAGPPLSESTALWWSLGGTIGAYGMIMLGGSLERSTPNSSAAEAAGTIGAFGVFLAPGFGHWYAGKYWTRGLGLRLGSIGVLFGGLLIALTADPCPLFGGHDDAGCDSGNTPGAIAVAAVIAAGGMFVWGTVDDIIDAPRRARRINAEAAAGYTLSLAPLRARDATGLAIVGRW